MHRYISIDILVSKDAERRCSCDSEYLFSNYPLLSKHQTTLKTTCIFPDYTLTDQFSLAEARHNNSLSLQVTPIPHIQRRQRAQHQRNVFNRLANTPCSAIQSTFNTPVQRLKRDASYNFNTSASSGMLITCMCKGLHDTLFVICGFLKLSQLHDFMLPMCTCQAFVMYFNRLF